MKGLVPFALKDVRFKIGGDISAGEREENVSHIPVFKPVYDAWRISFQRLWSVLFDPEKYKGATESKDLCRSVRQELDA